MKRVAVVTESSSCVPREVVERYGIHILPLVLIFEDRQYRDGVDMTAEEFYRRLKKAKKLPTTSSPSPGEFFEAFRDLSRTTDSVFCITLPGHLGMAYEAATKAKDLAAHCLPNLRIEVFPSRSPALAQGFIAQAAAEAAAKGGDLAEVTRAADDMMDRVHSLAVLDTLYFLAKGGRIPKAAAWAGSVFKIKPIIDATNDVRLLERCRTKSRALGKLVDIMKHRMNGGPVCVNLMHADVPDEAERLKAQIQGRFDCREFYITDFTPVIGAHTGPGCLGITFYEALAAA